MANTNRNGSFKLDPKEKLDQAIQNQELKKLRFRTAKHLCQSLKIDPYGTQLIGRIGKSIHHRNLHVVEHWVNDQSDSDSTGENLKELSLRLRDYLIDSWDENF
ncbi:hypothetical protein GPB2148_1547 [marine gamma proteobacterium HTCC2148]|nr:hypothetical protein GPB2148_1547 [marine gamma proteobacterium HTCC2148]